MQGIFSSFKNLSKPQEETGAQNFNAVTINDSIHRVGKDSSGWPVILLKITSDEKSPQIHLEHLSVQYSVKCRVTSEGESEEGYFTVIRCNDADEQLAEYFLCSIDPVIKILGPTPTSKEVSSAITHLIELFRTLNQPPIKSVSGLWAELFFIRNAKDSLFLLDAWHSKPEEKYDFNSGIQRIEVKSTSQRKRIHHFSLEQLTPPKESKVIVASIFVEQSGGGLSLHGLLEEIREICLENFELQEKLDLVVASTLGNVLQKSLAIRFDRELAKESLQMFDAEVIPKILESLPQEISEVHFKSDLNQCKNLSKQELLDAGGIFAASVAI